MANYYLKNADATRIHRVVYESDNGNITIAGAYACATGASAKLPNGNLVESIDQPVDVGQVLIDVVLNSLVPGTVTEYRELAKVMTDAKWS
jgi:hypothetical protein